MFVDCIISFIFTVQPRGPYWVVSTDYDSYAVVWSCSERRIPFLRLAWNTREYSTAEWWQSKMLSKSMNPNHIMLTSPCIVYPLTPHFYIVKLGLTGVYNFFLIFVLKHRLWVLVRTASLR